MRAGWNNKRGRANRGGQKIQTFVHKFVVTLVRSRDVFYPISVRVGPDIAVTIFFI